MNEKLNMLSDEELMSLYQSGDSLAFEVLYGRHAGRVLDFLQRRTNPQNGRDLLQETFLKFHRARHQYSVRYPFLPWLFTITRNVLVDFVRLKETKIGQNSTADIEQQSANSELASVWSDNLAGALRTLPVDQKRAIELRYLSDWTFEQIAADMKTSPANARQIISRGIKKLRSSFGGSK